MKKQILKIAGVKSEKEFYKKFPTEEAFMAKHGKEFKKAQIGTYMTSGSAPAPFQPLDVQGMQSDINYALTGMTDAERRQLAALQAQQANQMQQDNQSQGGSDQMMQMLSALAESGAAKKGKNIPKAQGGIGYPTGPQLTPAAGQQPTLQYQPSANAPAYIPNMAGATTNKPVNWAKGIPILGKIVGGIQKSKEAKNLLKQTLQQEQLTGAFAQAAMSRPVQQPRRQYVRPEDVVLQPQQMFPSYGVGTNVLAQDGAMIGGNPTEIQNMYNPGTLYTDLGYEPLNDTSKVKNYKKGGNLKRAQTGFETFMNQQGGNEIFGTVDQLGAFNDGGGDIGSGIGEAIGSVVPIPGAKPILTAAGRIIGSALDQKQEKTEASQKRGSQNVSNIVGQSAAMAIHNQFGLKEGGDVSPYEWVSHTWQPQKIVKFGEYSVKDLLKPPADADMLRAGGHLKEYTPPSERAMSTERPAMQMGGELQTHWGGYAEPMSYNPYLPEGGETIMFRGQSHDESDGKGNTGIGITYGDNPVEVERGEPAVKLQDGTSGESNLTVFGNIKITNAFADMLADPKAKGKKFKTYVADLSKQENKQNKLIDKSVEQLDSLNVQSSFDKLTLGTLQANIEGANAKLKDLADKKINAAALQNAINDTKEEELVKVTDSGDVLAEKGANIPKAQFGIPIQRSGPLLLPYQMVPSSGTPAPGRPTARQRQVAASNDNYVSKYGLQPWKGNVTGLGMATASELSAREWDEVADTLGFKGRGNKEFQEFLLSNPQSRPLIEARHKALYGKSPFVDERLGAGWQGVGELIKPKTGGLPRTLRTLPPTVLPTPSATPTKANVATVIPPNRGLSALSYLNQLLPYLRPSDAEVLDSSQLLGEMFALSQNQVEPVPAQKFIPELGVPMDISLQDILNENQATYNATQRQVGYNPAALASLNSQKYLANQRVLGEQFRLNQAEKQRVYSENRNLLNQARLQNLQILDTQAQRQAQALSNTKATTQAALNSIASKYAQNKLENRTLAVYENMYNYRFDPRFRAINMNPLQEFNMEGSLSSVRSSDATLAPGYEHLYDASGRVVSTRKKGKSEEGRNGAVAKAFKNL
jgi:hypothetical protein